MLYQTDSKQTEKQMQQHTYVNDQSAYPCKPHACQNENRNPAAMKNDKSHDGDCAAYLYTQRRVIVKMAATTSVCCTTKRTSRSHSSQPDYIRLRRSHRVIHKRLERAQHTIDPSPAPPLAARPRSARPAPRRAPAAQTSAAPSPPCQSAPRPGSQRHAPPSAGSKVCGHLRHLLGRDGRCARWQLGQQRACAVELRGDVLHARLGPLQ